MSRTYSDVSTSEYIDTGLTKLLERDTSTLTGMSGPGQMTSDINHLVYNDLTNRKIYLIQDDESLELINYNNGSIITKSKLSVSFQGLNTTLTKFSSTELSGQGVIVNEDFLPLNNFYKNSVGKCKSPDEFNNIIQLLGLAKRNKIISNVIENESISEDKFNFTFITDGLFNVGEVVYSYKNKARDGFLLLSDGATVGNSVSGASYANNKYLELFKILWEDSTNQIYTSTGATASRGESPTDDFNNNYRIALPYKMRKFSTRPGSVVAEYSVAVTDTIRVNVGGYYEITLVGAGGGGAIVDIPRFEPVGNYSILVPYYSSAGGGSGGYVGGVKYIPPGNYTLVVGNGINQIEGMIENTNASNGGATVFDGETAYGGRGGIINNGVATGGSGGTTDTTLTSANGNDGSSYTMKRKDSTPAPAGDSIYGGYGSGGTGGTRSGDGYARIKYIGPVNDESASLQAYNFLSNLSAYIKY